MIYELLEIALARASLGARPRAAEPQLTKQSSPKQETDNGSRTSTRTTFYDRERGAEGPPCRRRVEQSRSRPGIARLLGR
jgi:hypothetical protein